MKDPSISSTNQEPKTIASWPNLVAMALEAQGIDSRSIFAEAGILYRQVTDPSDRVETKKISKLFQLAVKATKEPCFGLAMAQFTHPATFHALGYSLFASGTLLDFCERLVRFLSLLTDNFAHHLEEQEGAYCLSLEPLNEHVCFESADAWMAVLVHFCRIIYRPDLKPQRVTFIRPEPECGRVHFGTFFKAPLSFSESMNAIYFDKADMYAALPAGNAELALRNDEIVIEYLARMHEKDIIRQIEAIIVELLPKGECNKDIIAGRLNLSPRTLQNKLEREGTNYRDIYDNLRKHLACQYIEHKDMPLGEITYMLGFSDTSNFSRAFRGWTGLSPGAYRKRQS